MGETLLHSLELLANHFFCNNVATEHTLDSLSFHPMENLLCYMLISYPFVVKKRGEECLCSFSHMLIKICEHKSVKAPPCTILKRAY